MPIVTGRVVEDQVPIKYITVQIGTKADITDENGNFAVDVPPGRYVVKVRSPMHFPVTEEITVPPEGIAGIRIDVKRAVF